MPRGDHKEGCACAFCKGRQGGGLASHKADCGCAFCSPVSRIASHKPDCKCTVCYGYKGDEHPSWKGDDVGYTAAHARIQKERGKASEHLCVDGCGRQAQQWSYDHGDGGYYSTDVDRYQPRCVPCHKAFDRVRA